MSGVMSSEDKKSTAKRVLSGPVASSIADRKTDDPHNVLAANELRADSSGQSVKQYHKTLETAGFAYPNATDYSQAAVGDMHHEYVADSLAETTNPYEYHRWVKHRIGWLRDSKLDHVGVNALLGTTSAQIDISVPRVGVGRYTYDATGDDPNWKTNGLRTGDWATVNCSNFSSANNGTFKVLAASDDAFDVVNADAVAEVNKVLDGTTSVQHATTLKQEQEVVVFNRATATTVTLPTAVNARGKFFFLKSIGAGNITIDGNAAETIDGSTTIVLRPRDSVLIKSDGANWQIVGTVQRYSLGGYGVTASDAGSSGSISAAGVTSNDSIAGSLTGSWTAGSSFGPTINKLACTTDGTVVYEISGTTHGGTSGGIAVWSVRDRYAA